jgi:hypothetical protein
MLDPFSTEFGATGGPPVGAQPCKVLPLMQAFAVVRDSARVMDVTPVRDAGTGRR